MTEILAVNLFNNQLWFALPLITAVSLVYGATRDERPIPILQNALRAAVWIVGFMLVVFVVILACVTAALSCEIYSLADDARYSRLRPSHLQRRSASNRAFPAD